MPHETVPADIAAAIDELMWAAEIQGQDTMSGDAERLSHAETHTNVCRMALNATIIRHLAELKAALEMQTSGAA